MTYLPRHARQRSQAGADCVNLSALPGIHGFLVVQQDVDGTATRACPSCAYLSAASRVNPTCS